MKKTIKSFLFCSVLVIAACTDLEVVEKDSVVIESESGVFEGIDPVSGLSTGYTDLRAWGDQANLYALLEITSDELLVPTRGTDWGDNGVWRTLHQHTWDITHEHVLNAWNNLNSNIFRLGQLLAPESGASAVQAAEGKFLRAYNVFLLIDLYGQVPLRGVNEGPDVNPQVLDRTAAFDFAMTDLTDALPDLPTISPGLGTIRASKAAAHFLMAKMLLNKHIYLGNADAAAADMTAVIGHVDAIAADGFALDAGYFDIFKNTADTETIFWTDTGVGNRMWCGLHYYQTSPDNTGGGWNGFSTTADFYSKFEGSTASNEPGNGQEERRGFVPNTATTTGVGYGFLVGQQYDKNGSPLNDRGGKPLVYTKTFPGLTGNSEREGIRIIKYHPENGAFTNHLIFFRYADAHLMKTEAIMRGGTSASVPLTLYNELRVLRGASVDAGPLSLTDIFDERGRELYIEGWRRNDQIRFGTYTNVTQLMQNPETFRVLFPIPSQAISTNPNLVQNPGY